MRRKIWNFGIFILFVCFSLQVLGCCDDKQSGDAGATFKDPIKAQGEWLLIKDGAKVVAVPFSHVISINFDDATVCRICYGDGRYYDQITVKGLTMDEVLSIVNEAKNNPKALK
jgi:hypothetical protein